MTGPAPVLAVWLAALLAAAARGDAEVARIRQGDARALRRFFDATHADLLRALARRGLDPATAEDVAQRAYVWVWEHRGQIDPDRKGMGTTLSMLLVTPAAAFLAHVGDSRIYMLRSGKVKMITSDHTYVAAMMEAGKMTAEEAARSRYSNLLVRAVGSHDYVEVDTRILRYRVGDVFLLCSDGLSGYLKEAEIPRRINVDDLPGSIERLIKLALDRGGKDNITAILVRIDP